VLLLNLIFVQHLLKLSDSSKGSLIRINCQEMGIYRSNKCSHPMYFNERRHRTWKLRPQWESYTKPCHCRHNNKATENDTTLQIFTTESRLIMNVLIANFSDRFSNCRWINSSNATLTNESTHIAF